MADDHIVPAVEIEQEEWRPIPGVEWSEASSLGRIRSLSHELRYMRMGRWQVRRCNGMIRKLVPSPNPSGIIYYRLNLAGGRIELVNRIICTVFHGDPPTQKHHAAHLDGNSLNNRANNLAWKTPAENGADKIRHGTPARGVRSPKAKLSEADVAAIFVAYVDGALLGEIAATFGVDITNINHIIHRKTWRHVFVDPELVIKAQATGRGNIGKYGKSRSRI